MDKYVCHCGYVYDPAVGDPDSGIAPGTAFEDIPDDWVCPVSPSPAPAVKGVSVCLCVRRLCKTGAVPLRCCVSPS